MLVLNAGMEVIEFGFNQNSRNPKEGGYYKILPGEQSDVPEGARELIIHPECGPGLMGLVILDFGVDEKEAKIQGLKQYIEFMSVCVGREEQRTRELEQVGVKMNYKRREVEAFEKKLEKAEAQLRLLEEAMSGDISTDGSQSKEESRRPDRIKPAKVLTESHP